MAAPRIVKPLTGAARDHLLTLEKQWAGSIHLSMLSAPLRRCNVTSKTLPTSLMLQLKAVTLPPTITDNDNDNDNSRSKKPALNSERERVVILPDQILHPQFAPRKVGRGIWVTLDPRIYTHLEKRPSYKVLNFKANLVGGMQDLIWTQLGERVVQEAQLLAQHFHGRKKIDLIHHQSPSATQESWPDSTSTIQISYTIDLNSNNSNNRGEQALLESIPVFAPNFKDQTQAERFAVAIRELGLLAENQPIQDVTTIYNIKKASVTVPLGVALYRLQLWSQSISAMPMDGDDEVKKSKV